ncbi:hypothetical protein PPL_01711 [Heterostelium album PN500]|uniref:Follistatin-like domain-containing protein n=1 Tax=Heterostelium pallidum (strain ATCC 26659 / Pp 5 / PN500) TaxID=670386 RepID=D3B095_HETP5|nr:hypothetical protein PPL_01711 [Heterostelium album PN500]EFA84719.1 hypothetical protein PPL_01711 [Heterostelium album PN500]|eukprot:XP_020436831.1 hypothetical protein PPL_01711 [Heterostelium album PN500]
MFNRINKPLLFLYLLYILSTNHIQLAYSEQTLLNNNQCSKLSTQQCRKNSNCLSIEAKSCCSSNLYSECQQLPLSLVRCNPIPNLNLWCLEDNSDLNQYDLWAFNTSSCHRPANSFIPLLSSCRDAQCPTGFECISARPQRTPCINSQSKCCNYRAKCVLSSDIDTTQTSSSDPSTDNTTPTKTSDNVDDLVRKNYPYNMVVPTCAAMKCSVGYECIDDPVKGAHCNPSCKAMKCLDGQRCVMNGLNKPTCITSCNFTTCPPAFQCIEDKEGGVRCVPVKSIPAKPVCTLDCIIGSKCVIDEITKKARCVPENYTTCATKKCPEGESCFDDLEKGAYCFKSGDPCLRKNCPVGTVCAIAANDTAKAYYNVQGGRCVSIYSSCMLLNCSKGYDCIMDKTSQLAKCVQIAVNETLSTKPLKDLLGITPAPAKTCERKCDPGFKCVDGQCVQLLTCANLRCPKGSKCVDNSTLYDGNPYCVPIPTCATNKCPGDCYCLESESGPQCIPKTSCALLDCRPEYRCVEDKERGARCIQRSIVTCSSISCLEGYSCIDDPINGGNCQKIDPKNPFKSWTPSAPGWSTTTKSGTPTTPPTTTSQPPNEETTTTTKPPPSTTQAKNECALLDCPPHTICMADKERGGYMCFSKQSCATSHCAFGEECIEDSNGVGTCRRITCNTLQCKLPKMCHSTPSGIPECQ